MPDATTRTIAAADGVPLVVRDWTVPAGTPRRGAALLVHGLGEHAGRYDHVAAVCTAHGVAVRSWDQRGFGRSGGARATLPHPDALLDDARAMFDALDADARAAGDDAPPFLVGHSMGGLVAARAATGGWIAPRGLVLSSPAIVPRLGPLDRLAAAIGARLAPRLRVPHRLPLDRLSHDPAVVDAIRADPHCHDRVTPGLATFMVRAGAQALRDAPRLAAPTLVIAAGDDALVDPEGARRFAEAMPAGLCTHVRLDDAYHEAFNEREPVRGRALAILGAWLAEQLGPG